jgi:hypothetical protein
MENDSAWAGIPAVPKGRREAVRQGQALTCNATPIIAAGFIYLASFRVTRLRGEIHPD